MIIDLLLCGWYVELMAILFFYFDLPFEYNISNSDFFCGTTVSFILISVEKKLFSYVLFCFINFSLGSVRTYEHMWDRGSDSNKV